VHEYIYYGRIYIFAQKYSQKYAREQISYIIYLNYYIRYIVQFTTYIIDMYLVLYLQVSSSSTEAYKSHAFGMQQLQFYGPPNPDLDELYIPPLDDLECGILFPYASLVSVPILVSSPSPTPTTTSVSASKEKKLPKPQKPKPRTKKIKHLTILGPSISEPEEPKLKSLDLPNISTEITEDNVDDYPFKVPPKRPRKDISIDMQDDAKAPKRPHPQEEESPEISKKPSNKKDKKKKKEKKK